MNPSREDMIRETLEWVGTPFHDCAGIKGVGTDCLHLLSGAAANVGFAVPALPTYKPQWFVHRDEALFLDGMARVARRVEEPLPGDFAMFNFGRHAAHGAIILDERRMVHAYKPAGFVIIDERATHAHRLHSYWSLFK